MIEFPLAFRQLNFQDSFAKCPLWAILEADTGDLNHAALVELWIVGEDIVHFLLKHVENLCAAEPHGHSDRRRNAVDNGITCSLSHAKQLAKVMDFLADVFAGLERHEHPLSILCRVKQPSQILILDG